MPKAIGYVRVSTDKQLDNTSIAKQKEEIIKFCNNNNLSLVKIYDEGAQSAESFKHRDEFKKMYHHALDKEEDVEFIVVFKGDRISRNNLDSLYIYRSLEKANKKLICIADNIDTRDPNAKLLYHIMAMISELEKDTIKLRTSVGMEKNADDGNFNGGKVFGYFSESKTLKLISEEAKVVRYIFERYAIDQWGYRKIASKLNEQGFKTKNEKMWTINAVKTVLTNQLYIGKTKWKGTYREGNHPRIIDDRLWNQAQKVLQLKSTFPEKIHPGTYPLSGLLKCPQCSASMVQGNSSQHYKYYQCSKNKNSGKAACSSNLVKKEYAEEYVFNYLYQKIKSGNIASFVFNATSQSLSTEITPIEEQLKSIRKEHEKLKEKKSELVNWRINGVINEDTFADQINKAQSEENELFGFIASLEKQLQQRNRTDLQETITLTFDKFEYFFQLMNDEDKKQLLHSLIESIEVRKADISKDRTIKNITFKFDLTHFLKVDQCA